VWRWLPLEGGVNCDPTQLVVPGAQPVSWGSLEVTDGVTLRHARIVPAEGPVRGTVVLVHGRTEFIEKYAEVLGELCARGFETFTMDWRGQGGSTRPLRDPDKGHVDDFRRYVDDLDHYVTTVVRPASHGGLMLLSHSMGGSVALHYLHGHCGVFQRAFLVAPMVDIALGPARPLLRRVVRGLHRVGQRESYVPGTGPYEHGEHRFEGNDLTSDPERFQLQHELIAVAPHLALGGPTYGWLVQAFDASQRLLAPGYPESITTPTTFVIAGGDTVVDNAQTTRLAQRMVDAEVVCVGGARHELLNEREVFIAQFWSAFDARVS
jgi:lysophospholipase